MSMLIGVTPRTGKEGTMEHEELNGRRGVGPDGQAWHLDTDAYNRIMNMQFYRGAFATPEALREAHPTDIEGSYAIVLSTETFWIWVGEWKDTGSKVTEIAGLPPGGDTGQVLSKKSDVDNDVHWVDQVGGGAVTSVHNNLSGLQGGSITERYHLTAAQHEKLTAGGDVVENHNDLKNIQGGTETERFHLTEAQVAKLEAGGGAENHNDLKNIQGGTETERFHLTEAQVAKLEAGGGAENHNDLKNIQGGTEVERYHLTKEQYDDIGNPFPLTDDEIDAINGANEPSSENVFATIKDLVPGEKIYIEIIKGPSVNMPSSNCVCYSESLKIFCAIITSGSISYTSSDGINWMTSALPANATWSSVCFSEKLGLFCAVPDRRNYVLTSPDGKSWTQRTAPSHQWSSICFSEKLGMFCVVSRNGMIMTSVDGINWSEVASVPSFHYTSICFSEKLGMFCAVGNTLDGAVTSNDGITWVKREYGRYFNISSVCFSEKLGLFCATAYDTSVSPSIIYIVTSNNGLTWSYAELKSAEGVMVRSVCFLESIGMFCAISSINAYTSVDGMIWDKHDSDSFISMMAVCASEYLKIFCIVSVGNPSVVMLANKTAVFPLSQNVVDALNNASNPSSDNVFVTHNDMATGLDSKVDKVDGKGLSTNDFTDEHKASIVANSASIADLNTSIRRAGPFLIDTNMIYVRVGDMISLYGFMSASIASGADVFLTDMLPSGYRPHTTINAPSMVQIGNGFSPASLVIAPNGSFTIKHYGGGTASSFYVSISFLTNDNFPNIIGTPPKITTLELPEAIRAVEYNYQLVATGSNPIAWSRVGGNLPPGLDFSSDGIISGIPETGGQDYYFTIHAKNNAGFDSRQFSIFVVPGK